MAPTSLKQTTSTDACGLWLVDVAIDASARARAAGAAYAGAV
jgi:hypothetical protein